MRMEPAAHETEEAAANQPFVHAPHRMADVTSRWVTSAFHSAGIGRESRVTEIASEPIGVGLMGESYRINLTWDAGDDDLPATVVAKFGTDDPGSRANAARLMMYVREVLFYQELAPRLRMATPQCFFSDIDVARNSF